MTHRILPPGEYSKLEGTKLGPVWRQLPIDGLTVFVVEDDAGTIIGHWTAFLAPHAEDVWLAPDHRGKGAVIRHLLTAMTEYVTKLGAEAYITFSATPQVDGIVQKLGASRLPGDGYSVPVRKG